MRYPKKNQKCGPPTGYKIQYAKKLIDNVTDSNIDEFKIEWTENTNCDIQEVDDSLWGTTYLRWSIFDDDTEYIARIAVQNENGWSDYSNIVIFETEDAFDE